MFTGIGASPPLIFLRSNPFHSCLATCGVSYNGNSASVSYNFSQTLDALGSQYLEYADPEFSSKTQNVCLPDRVQSYGDCLNGDPTADKHYPGLLRKQNPDYTGKIKYRGEMMQSCISAITSDTTTGVKFTLTLNESFLMPLCRIQSIYKSPYFTYCQSFGINCQWISQNFLRLFSATSKVATALTSITISPVPSTFKYRYYISQPPSFMVERIPRACLYATPLVAAYNQSNGVTLVPGTPSTLNFSLQNYTVVPDKWFLYVQMPTLQQYTVPPSGGSLNSIGEANRYPVINKISIQVGSSQRFFEDLNTYELWQMSARNGCKIPYAEWAGLVPNAVGSVLCFSPSDLFVVTTPDEKEKRETYFTAGQAIGSNLDITVTVTSPASSATQITNATVYLLASASNSMVVTPEEVIVKTTPVTNKNVWSGIDTGKEAAKIPVDDYGTMAGGSWFDSFKQGFTLPLHLLGMGNGGLVLGGSVFDTLRKGFSLLGLGSGGQAMTERQLSRSMLY